MNTLEFSGVRYGKITPTDIDGFMEFKDKAFIFVEAKYKDAILPFGQELALTRLCDQVSKDGKKAAVVFVVSWEELNSNGNIGFAGCMVTKIYTNKKWYEFDGTTRLDSFIDRFLIKHNLIKEGEASGYSEANK